jgi:hypothetical protein
MQNDYYDGLDYTNYPSTGMVVKLEYICVACQKFVRHFTVKIAEDCASVMKIGQYPPWDIAADDNILNMLGKRKSLLKQGLICESQNYGIAAFAYYRRIVEEVIDELLDSISDLLDESQKERYSAALSAVKATRQTSEKIDLVKDLLPPILRPNGMNPLALLHGVLSEGLHAETDDRCLELAVEVREILKFLAAQIEVSRAASRSFSSSMQSLLDKKSGKPTRGSSEDGN